MAEGKAPSEWELLEAAQTLATAEPLFRQAVTLLTELTGLNAQIYTDSDITRMVMKLLAQRRL